MIDTQSPQFKELKALYIKHYGGIIPLMMVPTSETLEGLTQKINASIEAGRNLLPELYAWDYDLMY